MLRIFSGILLALAISGCTESPYTKIGNDELKSLMAQGVPVYDIRRPEEWHDTGVIEGSQRLTFVGDDGRVLPDFLPRFTAAVSKDAPVILICHSGSRSDTLAKHLADNLGYTRIYNVRDGITHWTREQNPVTRN